MMNHIILCQDHISIILRLRRVCLFATPTSYLFTVVDWYFANGIESKYVDDEKKKMKRRRRPKEITFPKSSGSGWFVCWHMYK